MNYIMKLIFISFILLTFSIHTTLAQPPKLDSLKKFLDTDIKDSTYAQNLTEYAHLLSKQDPMEGINYASKALRLAGKLQMPLLSARCLNILGAAYTRTNQYDSAIANLLEASETFQSLGSLEGLAKVNNNLGVFYDKRKNYEQAKNYYRKGLDIWQELNDKVEMARSLNNIGSAYHNAMDLDSALIYYQKSFVIRRELGDSSMIAIAFLNMGGIQYLRQEYKPAEEYLLKAANVLNRYNRLPPLILAQRMLALIYLERKDFERCKKYLNKSETLALRIGSKQNEYEIYSTYSKLYEAFGQYERALHYHQKYSHLKDSIFSTKNNREVNNIIKQHEAEKAQAEKIIREQRIDLLESKVEIDTIYQNIYLAGIFVLLAIGALLGRSYHLKRIKDKAIIELKNKELTTSALQILKKNDQMNDLKEDISSLRESIDHSNPSKDLNRLLKRIDRSFNIDKEWESFKLIFEQTHQNFYANLKSKYPDIGPSDMKLCALLKLGFSSKQIAEILSLSSASVRTARYRLRKKFSIQREVNLLDFIAKI